MRSFHDMMILHVSFQTAGYKQPFGNDYLKRYMGSKLEGGNLDVVTTIPHLYNL